uniref:Uncharacterized protein n=1 Tax=Oryza sativa subsp. japonica TaxID=39947 RepID=Q6Z6T5_ORYSJ|nr:hypothetical protein [Oryza sativa Japonica Group]
MSNDPILDDSDRLVSNLGLYPLEPSILHNLDSLKSSGSDLDRDVNDEDGCNWFSMGNQTGKSKYPLGLARAAPSPIPIPRGGQIQ